MWHYNKIFIYLYLSIFGLLNLHAKICDVFHFNTVQSEWISNHAKQVMFNLSSTWGGVDFYSLFIDSLTPLIIFFCPLFYYHNEIKNHMCLFIYLSKSIIFRTDIYIHVIQNCFLRIDGQTNFNVLNSIRSRYLWFSIWITHTSLLQAIGGFSGRVAGLQPPPRLWSENFTPKKSFWSFLGL